MQGVSRILRSVERLALNDVEEHLSRRLAAGSVEKLVSETVDLPGLASLGDNVSRRDQRDRPSGSRRAEASTHLPACVRRKEVAVHITGASAHCSTRHDVLGHGVLKETERGVDLRLA